MNYQEIQRFSSLTWIWLILLPIVVFTWVTAYHQLVLGQAVGTRPVSNLMAVLLLIGIGTLMPLFFGFGGMRTEVRADGITIEGVPRLGCSKQFNYSEIESYSACQYHPLCEFGGWGIRWGRSGRAYTVSGNQGVQLVFKNGRRVLIGSKHPHRIVEEIDQQVQQLSD